MAPRQAYFLIIDAQAMTAVIWRFSDNKAGHDSQSSGLVAELSQRLTVNEYVLRAEAGFKPFCAWALRRYAPGAALPAPDLLVGAGHATHPHLLAARRCYGGRSVVLMKPSLPCAWFDLCLVPQHDRVKPADNVFTTRGVVNTIRPGGRHDDATGLIVLGGPSRHFIWNNETMRQQVEQLLRQRPRARWWLTTSRRTPAALLERLGRQPGLRCVSAAATEPGWLATRLAEAGEVWVSRDSMSMVYEALTSGARVGLLEVAGRGNNRVSAAVDQLVGEGLVGAPGCWQSPPQSVQRLHEASRCADWIVKQWLNAG